MARLVLDIALDLLRLPLLPLWWLMRRMTMPKERWIHVVLRGQVVEVARPVHAMARFVPALAERRPTSLSALRELTTWIARDANVDGIVWEIPAMQSSWAVLGEVRALMKKQRAVGKRVVAWLPDGGGNRELFLASAADRILTTPNATLSPLGVAATSNYVRGLLDRVGVKVEVHRRSEFKTAAETATEEGMSEPQREQLQALLGTIDGALVEALSERPGLDDAAVRALFAEAMLSARAALSAKLVDGLCYEDGLRQALVMDGGEPPTMVRASRYLRFHTARFLRAVAPRPFVAVVPVYGTITSGGAGAPAFGQRATQRALVTVLRALAKDRRVVGVVLHIESPGGSALASDLIHREVELLREKKPVVACFGEVAASGGYYIAAAADHIVASPLSITGSIGVVSARLVTEELLGKLGVRTEVVRFAPHADLLTNGRPMDAEEHAIVDREIDAFYRAFVGVVAKGRRRDEAEIEPLARGRVWSGRDAHARGLVDELGGLDVAVDAVRARVRLPAAIARFVEPRVMWPRDEDASPIPIGALAALSGHEGSLEAALAMRVDPGPATLASLCRGPDRVLFYDPSLPRLD